MYMPYDDDTKNSPAEIKSRDMDAIKSSEAVVLELRETSLGVAQELGAARPWETGHSDYAEPEGDLS